MDDRLTLKGHPSFQDERKEGDFGRKSDASV